MATILVVEDHEDIRSMILFMLAKDHIVIEARDGKEGWELFQTCQPDCVITDYFMPKFNGFELIKKIRALNNQAIIILMSASIRDLAQAARLVGATAFIEKPADFDRINEIIDEVLKNKPAINNHLLR